MYAYMISHIVEFYNQPKLCPDAIWSQSGTVYPYNDRNLSLPRSIFVDKNNTVYVSFDNKGIVIVWSEGNETPSRIYHGNQSLTNLLNIVNVLAKTYEGFNGFIERITDWWNSFWGDYMPDVSNSLFVIANEDIYAGKGDSNNIVIWSNDGKYAEISMEKDHTCYGLFIDINDTIYCSLKNENKVITKSIKDGSRSWAVRADQVYTTGFFGADILRSLHGPHGIFVDIDFSLFVTEYNENIILIFIPGQTNTRTKVAENMMFDYKTLNGPTNIILDFDRNLYIVDSHNHRVVFVTADFHSGRCLVGCSHGVGSNLNQMRVPTGLSFDSVGNILVSDTYNNRVLKFQLETNSCGKS